MRGSRELASAPEESAIAPIHLEIVEPLKQIRFRLEPNDVQPISFDIVLSAVTPPFFEERNLVRNRRTGRIDVDVIRYHQGGWASGTVTVHGETFDVNPDEWFDDGGGPAFVREGDAEAPRTGSSALPRSHSRLEDDEMNRPLLQRGNT